MPELPDITIYVESLQKRILGLQIRRIRIINPFFLRTYDPPLENCIGKSVVAVLRIGKRIVFQLEAGLYVVIHLMVLGRMVWREISSVIPRKACLGAIDFDSGRLLFTESGSKHRASLHLVRGSEQLKSFDRGGLEVLDSDRSTFSKTLIRENHTLKRTLTDPSIFSGIGNSFSDEILHAAGLSPFTLSTSLSAEEQSRLFIATRDTLSEWTERIRAEVGDNFPKKVTAFKKQMAVHGRYQQPCPVCATPIQRIRYAENECNYCPTCQTGGKLYADRGLSRLLKKDWPKSLEELEALAGKIKEGAQDADRNPRPNSAAT